MTGAGASSRAGRAGRTGAGVEEVLARHVGAGEDDVPGAVALVAQGDDVEVTVAGAMSFDGPPMRRDTHFRIASMTKPILGATLAALVSEGLVALDEPVDHLLPEMADRQVLVRPDAALHETVPAKRAVTVRDLATFTFGFGMVIEMFGASEPWPIVTAARPLATLGPPEPAATPEPDEWMELFGSLPLIAQPGERWMYNTGAQVLGVLCARVAHAPLGEVMRTRIFDPCGMRDTAFWSAEPHRLATAYHPKGHRVWDAPTGQWGQAPKFPDGAAGLVSTADDMLAFSRMILARGAGVLPEDLVKELTTNQLTPAQMHKDPILGDAGWSLCQSVIVDGPRAGAFGWAGGLGTTWLADPARDLTIVVLTQRLFSSPTGDALHTEVQDAAYAGAARG